MNRKLLGFFIILLAMIISGFIGYSIKGVAMENSKKEVASNLPKSNEIQSSNVDTKSNDLLV
jgi:amino acid permease